jgi:YVTN family beta-propeller protein
MKIRLLLLVIFYISSGYAQSGHGYRIVKTFHIASAGGWDYIAVHDNKLYVSHGSQVNILDQQSGDSLSFIPNTTGVHGIAFNNALNKGYTSNGRLNNVSVFNLETNKVTAGIPTGKNPDAILFEPFSKTIITCNGGSNDLSVIDPVKERVVRTIDVGGKPETAVTDEKGRLFVNIEDKNEIVEIDLKKFAVRHHWSLGGAEGPTGLAIDRNTKRLYAGCDNTLVVLNAENGKVVASVPIGGGCDGVAFNNISKLIFTSNGEGSMSVIQEQGNDKYTSLGNFTTKKGARTIAIDEKMSAIYLPTADFDPVKKGANGRPLMVPGSFQVLVVQ